VRICTNRDVRWPACSDCGHASTAHPGRYNPSLGACFVCTVLAFMADVTLAFEKTTDVVDALATVPEDYPQVGGRPIEFPTESKTADDVVVPADVPAINLTAEYSLAEMTPEPWMLPPVVSDLPDTEEGTP
jgi:hypothetical protein